MTRTIRRLAFAAVALATVLFAAPAHAALVFVPNGDFQTPEVADGAFTFNTAAVDTSTVPNWTFTSNETGLITGGVWDPQNLDYANATGNNAILPGTADGGQTGYIYLAQSDDNNPQPLGGRLQLNEPFVTLSSLRRYTLTVALGNALSYDPGDVALQILINGNVEESLSIPAGTIPNGTFTDFSTFIETTANDPRAGSTLTIAIIHNFGGIGEREVEFDHVRFDVTILPEPATAALALLAVPIFALRRTRGLATSVAS